jgi:hypothetical protein
MRIRRSEGLKRKGGRWMDGREPLSKRDPRKTSWKAKGRLARSYSWY